MLDRLYFHWGSTGFLSSIWRFMVFISTTFYYELFVSIHFRFNIRRIWTYVVLATTLFFLMAWNHIGFMLDEYLYPEWRCQVVDRPLFIVGNARSGTTWLHRLITLDDSSFTTFKTWEILFAAAVTWKKMFFALYLIDKTWFNGASFARIIALESYFVGNVNIHQIGLMEAEEDEWLMIHICMSQLVMLMFPEGGFILNPLVLFDSGESTALPNEMKVLLMAYYRDCVKKHLFVRPKGMIFVSKNPAYTMRIQTIYRLFPDAAIVCLVRDPTQSVPSMVSYIAHAWRVFATPIEKYPQFATLFQFCVAHYTFPLDHLNSKSRRDDSWAFVSYAELRSNLPATVLNLLHRLKYFLPETSALKLQGRLKIEQRRAKHYVSSHVHSIADCCNISNEEFCQLFAPVYAAHANIFSLQHGQSKAIALQ